MTKPSVEQLKQANTSRYSLEAEIGVCGMRAEFRGRNVEENRPLRISAPNPQHLAPVGVTSFQRTTEVLYEMLAGEPEIVETLLARNPADRFQTAEEFLHVLDELTLPPPPPPPGWRRLWWYLTDRFLGETKA